MATRDEQWRKFWKWELEICQKDDPNYSQGQFRQETEESFRRCSPGFVRDWLEATDQIRHARAELKWCIDVTNLCCDEINVILSQSGEESVYNTPSMRLNAHQNLRRALDDENQWRDRYDLHLQRLMEFVAQKCPDGEDWCTQRNIDYVLQLDAERVDREERYGGRLEKHRDAWGDLSGLEALIRGPTPPPPVISSHTQSSPNQEKARGGENVTARDSDQSVNKDAAVPQPATAVNENDTKGDPARIGSHIDRDAPVAGKEEARPVSARTRAKSLKAAFVLERSTKPSGLREGAGKRPAPFKWNGSTESLVKMKRAVSGLKPLNTSASTPVRIRSAPAVLIGTSFGLFRKLVNSQSSHVSSEHSSPDDNADGQEREGSNSGSKRSASAGAERTRNRKRQKTESSTNRNTTEASRVRSEAFSKSAPKGIRARVAAKGREKRSLKIAWEDFINEVRSDGIPNYLVDKYETLAKRAIAVHLPDSFGTFRPILPPHRDGRREQAVYSVLLRAIRSAEDPEFIEAWNAYVWMVYQLQGATLAADADAYFDRICHLYDKGLDNILPPASAWELGRDADNDVRKLQRKVENTDLQGNWKLIAELGAGGQGCANLYHRFDQDDNIIDRIVLKDSILKPGHWTQPMFWSDEEMKVHMEVAALQALGGVDAHPRCIPWYRGYKAHRQLSLYRLYSEFCEHGDLESVIEDHVNNTDSTNRGRHVPQQAILSIFRAMVKAAFLMQYGALPNEKGEPINVNEDWRPLVHCDIKPANVFLSTPSNDVWPGIPMPKLGDYGVSLYIDRLTPAHGTGGTPSFMAPEQHNVNDPQQWHRVASWTNVFAIGKTIKALIELQRSKFVQAVHFSDDPPASQRIEITARPHYDDRLMWLVDRCLEVQPDQRITVNELWKILDLFCGLPADRSKETRTLRKPNVPTKISEGLEEGDVYEYSKDIYMKFSKNHG